VVSIDEKEQSMNPTLEQELRERLSRLEQENESLRSLNTLLQAQRKEYLDIICGPVRHEELPTEIEYENWTRSRIPADLALSDLDEILKNGGA
jgi:hypothetical protein